MVLLVTLPRDALISLLWESDRSIERLLRDAEGLHEARDRLFDYLNAMERHYFNIYSDRHFKDLHILEKNLAKQCIRVLKNVIRTENERITGVSALRVLFGLARNEDAVEVGNGFLCEMVMLFRAINGNTGLYPKMAEDAGPGEGRERGAYRSRRLDVYASTARKGFGRYRTGLEPGSIRKRAAMRERLLDKLGGSTREWKSFRWQLGHVVRDFETLSGLVKLEPDELAGLAASKECDIPFQITPYYLSLFDPEGRSELDRAIRAQVLPSVAYCRSVRESRVKNVDMDFMQEKWTSPIEGITRRYPLVLILKPFDSCPQLCVYCQRNWEVKRLEETTMTRTKVNRAVDWIRKNENITEVLVTGGDPLTLGNRYLDNLLGKLARIDHLDRIRIGTRTPVTAPFRIDRGLLRILSKYHRWGKRELCIMTHFEHPTEVTPDVVEAVRKLRGCGINVYNQQVFTYYNSRRFETALLRKVLKVCGINPYYSFITKGKEETMDFRVPIARIQQEVAEEARLLPGVIRSDEPVFNVPRLGKSYLRAWQDHEPIMLLPDGRRVYRFYPWEARQNVVDDYIYTDVSIRDYLRRLHADGEDLAEYRSIWYYF